MNKKEGEKGKHTDLIQEENHAGVGEPPQVADLIKQIQGLHIHPSIHPFIDNQSVRMNSQHFKTNLLHTVLTLILVQHLIVL